MENRDEMKRAYNHPNPFRRAIDTERIKLILQEIKEGDAVLDAGCEEGEILEKISKKAGVVYGFDIDQGYVNASKERRIGNAHVFAGDVCNIPAKDGSFDAVVCTEVLEHLKNPQEGIKELKRVTKKGGRLIITVPNEGLAIKIKKILKLLHISKLFVISEEKSKGHVTEFNKKKTYGLLKECGGLGIEKTKLFPIWAPVRVLAVAKKN